MTPNGPNHGKKKPWKPYIFNSNDILLAKYLAMRVVNTGFTNSILSNNRDDHF